MGVKGGPKGGGQPRKDGHSYNLFRSNTRGGGDRKPRANTQKNFFQKSLAVRIANITENRASGIIRPVKKIYHQRNAEKSGAGKGTSLTPWIDNSTLLNRGSRGPRRGAHATKPLMKKKKKVAEPRAAGWGGPGGAASKPLTNCQGKKQSKTLRGGRKGGGSPEQKRGIKP